MENGQTFFAQSKEALFLGSSEHSVTCPLNQDNQFSNVTKHCTLLNVRVSRLEKWQS